MTSNSVYLVYFKTLNFLFKRLDIMRCKCWCKATNQEKSEPRYSQNWATAKRAWLKIFDDYIKCGDWKINIDEIESAHIYHSKQ